MPVGLSPEGKVPKVKLKVKLQLAFKRLLDLAAAALLLLLLSPLMAALALLVRIKLGRPVLFRQVRPGLHGRPFCIYKFRTMTGERDGGGRLLPDEERLTPTGRWLRRFSLVSMFSENVTLNIAKLFSENVTPL